MPHGLQIRDDGIRHNSFADTVLPWADIVVADHISVWDGTAIIRSDYLTLTLKPEAFSRLNARLPFYRRFYMQWLFNNKIRLDISNGTTSPEQIFNLVKAHVPVSVQQKKSAIERVAEAMIIQTNQTTATEIPREN